MFPFGLTGVTLAEKWTTDNVLTTQITVEDQVQSNFYPKKLCPEQLLKIANISDVKFNCFLGAWKWNHHVLSQARTMQNELILTNNYWGRMNRITLSHTLPRTTPPLSLFLLRPIYTVQLCHRQQAYDRPTTWIVSFKWNLQLAYNCCVVPKSCHTPIVSLLCATKLCRINEPLQLLPCCPCFYGSSKLSTTVSFKNCGNFCVLTCH